MRVCAAASSYPVFLSSSSPAGAEPFCFHCTHASGLLQPSLLDSFEYGMCGKVFRYDHLEDARVSIIASYGGLLMQLKGEMRHLVRIKMDDKIYALMRKA